MVFDINKSVSELNADIEKMSYWAYNRKLQFNPDPNKQANEVIFSRKPSSNNLSYPPIKFKCPYSELFWSAFSRIWTEFGEIL